MIRLTARPTAPAGPPYEPGIHHLGQRPERDTLLYVPSTVAETGNAAVVVCLHGAGADARAGLAALMPSAERAGLLLVAPASAGRTWDVIEGGYGPDVALIDDALRIVFRRVAVAVDRVHVGGFSDGASYALSLGLTNGDLFGRIVAFSPGFAAPAGYVGQPQIFVSHGTGDRVLPIGRTSRRIVPVLRGAGYDVVYREFDGGHTVPPGIASEAAGWLAGAELRS